MKLVTAIIKPFKLDDVRVALTELGVEGMTVTEVQGFGRQRGHVGENGDPGHHTVNFLPKMKLEVAVSEGITEQVVEAIRGAASTDRIGDGKIFVMPIEQAVRIRTGETGDKAL